MLTAREFYGLQKMQKQGKLANNPRAAALLNKVTETLNKTAQKHTNEAAESILHPQLNTKHQTAPSKKKAKKKKKKKPTKPDTIDPHQQISGASSTAYTLPDKKHSRTPDASGETEQLSKNQRKRLRKRLKKQGPELTTRQTTGDSNVSIQPPATGLKRQLPLPVSPSEEPLVHSKKRPRTSPDPQTDPVKQTLEPLHQKYKSLDTSESTHAKTERQFIPVDPVALGRKELEALLTPISISDFFAKYFEKQPLLIQRKGSFENQWLTTYEIDTLLRQERVMFTEHLDLAAYEDGRRYTLNPPGQAFPSVVWDHYNTGCSVRLLCPQVFFRNIRERLSLLQEYFGCFIGANVYLTPPGSQGFAPHYDDIEAFVLQLEGTKRWRVYAPRDESEKLACDPSPNFSQEEIGEPILTATLKPGDVLYFPRGYIHQAETSEDAHSLHLTISTYQKHSWGDFLSKLLPIALQSAVETSVEFRKGLPVGFLRHVGGFSQSISSKEKDKLGEATKVVAHVRAEVVARLRMLADQLERQASTGQPEPSSAPCQSLTAPDPLLTAADLFATDLIAQSLPPQLRDEELMCHVRSQGERWSLCTAAEDGSGGSKKPGVVDLVELEPDTKVRLVRWSAVRAVRTRVASATGAPVSNRDESTDDEGSGSESEEEPKDLIAVYHSLSNTNVYKERPLDEMALHRKLLPALDYLARQYPSFVKVDNLPLATLDDRMNAAIGLYEAGLLITREPLSPMDDAVTSSEDEAESEGSSDNVTHSFEEEDDPTDSDDLDPDELVDEESDDENGDEEEEDSLDDLRFDDLDGSYYSDESSEPSPPPPVNSKQKQKPMAALPAPNKQKSKKKKRTSK
ncbi:lysine-specific demethylase NO66 [Clonorchis sinensis]|uniref:Bifunctional lysine-specific demethylase and histidyl-hydroxylase n=1 Tax=Clonorchis sinensis TaxID=79923 RepID=G7YIJ2_CLOSI|nr:lysine-specific demethylase NO66 [Clonorchis sinensis]